MIIKIGAALAMLGTLVTAHEHQHQHQKSFDFINTLTHRDSRTGGPSMIEQVQYVQMAVDMI